MNLRKLVLMLFSSLLLTGSTGCSGAWEEGLRDGLATGLSNALAAVIEVPVNYALDQQFSAE